MASAIALDGSALGQLAGFTPSIPERVEVDNARGIAGGGGPAGLAERMIFAFREARPQFS